MLARCWALRRFCKKTGLEEDAPCNLMHRLALGAMLGRSLVALFDASSARCFIGVWICLRARSLAYVGSVGLWSFVCGFRLAALQRLFWREDRVLLCADCKHLEGSTVFVGALLSTA